MTETHQLADRIESTMDRIEANYEGSSPITKTGHDDLDRILNGGLRAGQLIVVGGQTAHGKSTLCLDMVRQTAIRGGETALLFTLEGIADGVTQRIFCAESDVSYAASQAGHMTDDAWVRMTEVIPAIESAPILINDRAKTINYVTKVSRSMAEEHDLGLIVVDDLNLLSANRPMESRYQEVSEFSRELKRLAKDLEVPVVAVSQLHRGIEARGDDALPKLSDLRDSGTLEADADVVILVNRPDTHNRDHERAGEVDLIVAKNRGGAAGTVRLAHQLHYCKFADLVPAR